MTNYATGHEAEKVAATYLETLGYKIIELNWRHARAEIDIVAQKRSRFGLLKQPLVFFEVKYRKTTAQGRGLDYITPKKLQQMQFAAQLYVTAHSYEGEFCLGAVEVFGENYTIEAVIDQL